MTFRFQAHGLPQILWLPEGITSEVTNFDTEIPLYVFFSIIIILTVSSPFFF